jgi:hypothetical protein
LTNHKGVSIDQMTIDGYIRTHVMRELKRGVLEEQDDEFYFRLFGKLADKVRIATRKRCVKVFTQNAYQRTTVIKRELLNAVVDEIDI